MIEDFVGALLTLILLSVVFLGFNPIAGLLAFRAAWINPKENGSGHIAGRVLLLFPTVVCPVVLLLIHLSESQLTWRVYGDDWIWYLAVDDCCWLYLLPFVGANGLIGVSILRPDFQKGGLLIYLALFACAAISLLFTVGNFHRGPDCIFPGSAFISYLYAFYLRRRIDGKPELTLINRLVLAAAAIGTLVTALANRAIAIRLVERLPQHPTENCFIVSAAARGHRRFVGSWLDAESGRITSEQLQTFRQFEALLAAKWPRFHCHLRRIYNFVGPKIAGVIVFRWQADAVYLVLKPLESVVRQLTRSFP